MKFTKLSLVAALVVSSSAFAIENIKVSGDTQFFYNTNDSTNGVEMFDKRASSADAALHLNLTADLLKNISTGVGLTGVSTLGLENNLVSGVWSGAHSAKTDGSSYGSNVENALWFDQVWIAGTYGKTTTKAGRMELDTPLAFTETWSVSKNTFEALVVINQDIPDTSLVGAYVGSGNGSETFGTDKSSSVSPTGNVVNVDGEFTTYGSDGAYTIGAINNSYKPVTVQAWYYDVTRVATAYWLQADLNIDNILAGAQYVSETADDNVANNADANSAYALMVGYDIKDIITAKLSYSSVDKDGALANTGTNTATETSASKLYTEAWWTYGVVTAKDTTAVNLTIESPVNGIVDLGLYAVITDAKANNSDMTEITVTASKTFGPLDTSIAYIYDDVDGSDAVNTFQAFLTLNF